MEPIQIGLESVMRHFEELEDPRSEVNLRHPLVSMVVISLMAVLAGAAGPTAIARWATLKVEQLLKVDTPHLLGGFLLFLFGLIGVGFVGSSIGVAPGGFDVALIPLGVGCFELLEFVSLLRGEVIFLADVFC